MLRASKWSVYELSENANRGLVPNCTSLKLDRRTREHRRRCIVAGLAAVHHAHRYWREVPVHHMLSCVARIPWTTFSYDVL